MSATFVNSGSVQPAYSQEILVCTLAGGPFEKIDGYVSGGDPGTSYAFRLYATVGTLRALVAQAPYIGSNPGRLAWEQVSSDASLQRGGTSFDLVVFSPLPTQGAITATLAGVGASDVAGFVNTSASVLLPPNTDEVTIATVAGYSDLADVSCALKSLPALQFNLYASCGAGSVEVLLQSQPTNSIGGASEAIMLGASLGVATTYRLAVRKLQTDNARQTCTASIAIYPEIREGTSGGGGGFVAANVAALLAAPTADSPIQVLGYNAPADGGGGLFIFDPASNAAVDDGIVFRPTSIPVGPGRWVRDFDGDMINALWFGLVGDGATPNDAAQGRLVNSVAAQAGKGIFYPEGLYVFVMTVGPYPLSSFVRGVGLQSRPGFGAATGTVFLLQDPNIGVQLGHDPASNIANGSDIWGIQFVGDNAGGLNEVGVEILNDAQVTIRNCRFGAFKYQLSFDGCEVCEAHDVYFDAVPRIGRGYPAASMGMDLGVASAFAFRFGSFHSMGGSLACNANVLSLAEFNNTAWAGFHSGGVGNIVRDSSGENGAGIAITATVSISTLHENMNFEGGGHACYLIQDTHYNLTLRNIIPSSGAPLAIITGPVIGFNLYDTFLRLMTVVPVQGSNFIFGGFCAGCLPPIGGTSPEVIFDVDNPRMIIDSGFGATGPRFGVNCQPLSQLDVNGNSIRIRVTLTPASSADPTGNVGDIAWDAGFVYVKTAGGWMRSAIAAF